MARFREQECRAAGASCRADTHRTRIRAAQENRIALRSPLRQDQSSGKPGGEVGVSGQADWLARTEVQDQCANVWKPHPYAETGDRIKVQDRPADPAENGRSDRILDAGG